MSTPWAAENIVMSIGLIVVGALAVVAALVAAAVLMRPSKARFSFENRDDHIVLAIEGRLAYDEFALITMSALREAVRLKLGSDYKRLMIDARKLTIVDESAFWILIGGLGPALLTDAVKGAVICGRRTDAAKRLRDSGLFDLFESERAALTHLRSSEPARAVVLDRSWVESLLFARNRAPAPPRRRAA